MPGRSNLKREFHGRELEDIPPLPRESNDTQTKPIPPCWPFRSSIPSERDIATFEMCNNIADASVCQNTKQCTWKRRKEFLTNEERNPRTYKDKLSAFHGCMPTEQLPFVRRLIANMQPKNRDKSAQAIEQIGSRALSEYTFKRGVAIKSLQSLNDFAEGQRAGLKRSDIEKYREAVREAVDDRWMVDSAEVAQGEESSLSDHEKLKRYFKRFEDWYVTYQSSNKFKKSK